MFDVFDWNLGLLIYNYTNRPKESNCANSACCCGESQSDGPGNPEGLLRLESVSVHSQRCQAQRVWLATCESMKKSNKYSHKKSKTLRDTRVILSTKPFLQCNEY